jgi:hypothetical protein
VPARPRSIAAWRNAVLAVARKVGDDSEGALSAAYPSSFAPWQSWQYLA